MRIEEKGSSFHESRTFSWSLFCSDGDSDDDYCDDDYGNGGGGGGGGGHGGWDDDDCDGNILFTG